MTDHISRHFDVAIIGGGFAGVYCAQQVLKRLGNNRLRIGIIAAENHMVFQPMLAEVAGDVTDLGERTESGAR